MPCPVLGKARMEADGDVLGRVLVRLGPAPFPGRRRPSGRTGAFGRDHTLVTSRSPAGSQRSRRASMCASAQGQHSRPASAKTGPSGAGPWHSLQMASMSCSLRRWSPVAGSWFVVCSGAGGQRRRHRAGAQPDGPGGQDVFQRAKERNCAGEAGPRTARGPEKDLDRPERAQREAGCAPDRACETDKPGYAADLATGDLPRQQALGVTGRRAVRLCPQGIEIAQGERPLSGGGALPLALRRQPPVQGRVQVLPAQRARISPPENDQPRPARRWRAP